MKKYLVRTATVAAAGALAASAIAATPAQAIEQERAGQKSLVKVLGADGVKLDKNGDDFDITEAAVLAVLGAKPDSPVGLLAQGNVRLTAFLPTDDAFGELVRDLKGFFPKNEKKTLKQVTKIADVDTLETILLYHVVPGATLTSPKVLKAAAGNGTKLETAADGATWKVKIQPGGVKLIDKDRDDANPAAIPALLDINRGNKQVAHGIDRVLRPIDL